MKRLYVVTRADLPAGAQLAQSCHALREFVAAHPDLDRAWHEGSKNLVVLSVPNEPALAALKAAADVAGVPVVENREPDFGDALTSIALADTGARLLSSLPLALKEPRCRRCRGVVITAPCSTCD